MNSLCNYDRPESADCWRSEPLPAAMFPSLVEWSVSRVQSSEPPNEAEVGSEALHVLSQHSGRNVSDENKEHVGPTYFESTKSLVSKCCVF